MTPKRPGVRAAWPVLAVAAVAVTRLWLVASQARTAWPYAAFDDGLFLRLAGAVVRGEWLGRYDELTLVKGPFYPLWVAAHSLHPLPLYLADQLLYLLGAAILAAAVRPAVGRAATVALFALVAFNPMSFSAQITIRYLRDGIYPALTLLAIGAAIGLLMRRHRAGRALAGWSTLLGVALAAAWLCREEGVWLVPAVGAALLVAWLGRPRESRGEAVRRLAVLLLPAAILGAALALVATVNRSQYGLFTTNELKRPEVAAALGALQRVAPEDRLRWVPVRLSAQRLVAEASPAFRELTPHLKPLSSENVFRRRLGVQDDPRYQGELMGGWFVWALRRAAKRAGHHGSPGEAMAFYRRLADEIDVACGAGELSCAPPRSSLAPPLSAELLVELPTALWAGTRILASFLPYLDRGWPSRGRPVALRLSREFTGDRFEPVGPTARPLPPTGDPRSRLRLWTAAIYARAMPVVLALAAGGFLLLPALARASRRTPAERARAPGSAEPLSDGWRAAAILALAVATRLALVSWISTVSFHAFHARYLAPAYPLAIAFACLVLWAAAARLIRRRRATRLSQGG